MPDVVHAVADSPWVLVLVFVVAGLDAVLPFMPSESTVVAVAVVAAGTGSPDPVALVAVAAAGAFVGDRSAYVIGRRGHRMVAARLDRGRRSRAVHAWVHRLLHSRGGVVIVFARYLPGGRSVTAFSAGVVGYPAVRFGWYTAVGVLVWAGEAVLLGWAGGALFADRPLLALAAGWGGAVLVTGIAALIQRWVPGRTFRSRPAAAGTSGSSASRRR
jgi:membrane-associated protein